MNITKIKWEMPPIEKVHEAYSAVADERVELYDDYALVSSSDYKKQYEVRWFDMEYSSNDNASYWHGYIGYPVIAVLMIQGKLRYSKDVADNFKNINWKKLNTENKNNYAKSVDVIMDGLEQLGINLTEIDKDIEAVYTQLQMLAIIYKKSKLLPPK